MELRSCSRLRVLNLEQDFKVIWCLQTSKIEIRWFQNGPGRLQKEARRLKMAPQSCSRLSFVNLDQDFDIIWCLWKSKMAVFQRIWDPIMICTRPVYQPSSSTLRMQARLSFLYILSDSDGISCLPQIMILAMMMMIFISMCTYVC